MNFCIACQGRNLEVRRMGKLDLTNECNFPTSFSLSDLKKAFENWVKNNSSTVPHSETVTLKDFRTGTPEMRDYGTIIFELRNLFKTTIVRGKQPDNDKQKNVTESDSRLGDFKHFILDSSN